jgi:hypothetical protein
MSGGDPGRARSYLAQAGISAYETGSAGEAFEFLSRAAAIPSDSDDSHEESHLRAVLALSIYSVGNYAMAAPALLSALKYLGRKFPTTKMWKLAVLLPWAASNTTVLRRFGKSAPMSAPSRSGNKDQAQQDRVSVLGALFQTYMLLPDDVAKIDIVVAVVLMHKDALAAQDAGALSTAHTMLSIMCAAIGQKVRPPLPSPHPVPQPSHTLTLHSRLLLTTSTA